MKILFFATDSEGTGGIQAYSAELVRALRAAGAEVRVVDRRKAGSRLAMIAEAFWGALAGKPDIVVAGHAAFAPLALALSFFGFAPFAVCIYGIEVRDRLSGLQAFAIRRARAIVAISRYTEGELRKKVGTSLPPAALIPPTVDAARFAPGPASPDPAAASRLGIPAGRVILTVGRLASGEQYKGHDTVIEALPEILRNVPDALYVIVGDGDDRSRVEELAREQGVADRVRAVPRVSGELLPDYYRAASVFAMPSTGEGFGIVFLEAAASGVPAVGGNADGSREALLGGELGILVSPRDRAAVARAIIAVLRGDAPPALRDRVSLRSAMLRVYGREAFDRRVREWLLNL